MPTTKSAARRARNSARKNAQNIAVKTKVKKAQKSLLASIGAGKKDESAAALREAISQLDRAARKGVIKRGTADRKKSRLTLRLNKLVAAAK